MTNVPRAVLTATPVRIRWFFGLGDVQTAQSQPIIGTPTLVPVPSKMSSPREESESAMSSTGLRLGYAQQLLQPLQIGLQAINRLSGEGAWATQSGLEVQRLIHRIEHRLYQAVAFRLARR